MGRTSRIAVCVALVVGGLSVASPAGADTPDSRRAVTRTSPMGTTLRATLASAADQDWFRFRMARTAWARITLTYQPANYRLDVYDRSGRLVRSSARRFRQYEEVYRRLGAGTYFVRVRTQDGHFDRSRAYRLRFDVPRPGVQVLSASWWRIAQTGEPVYGCDVLNNTSFFQIVSEARATVYDRHGREIGHGDPGVVPSILRPHSHGVCEGEFSLPTGRHVGRIVVKMVRYSRTDFRTYPISVRANAPATAPGGTQFWGTVRNDGKRRAKVVSVDVGVWGPGGRLRDIVHAFATPFSVRAGASASFAATSTLAAPTDLARYWPSAAF